MGLVVHLVGASLAETSQVAASQAVALQAVGKQKGKKL